MSARYAPDTLVPANATGWATRAACKDMSLDMFFSTSSRDVSMARATCTGCPVRQECLDDAMEKEAGISIVSRSGVFGGTTPKERWEADPLTSPHAPPAVVDPEDDSPPHGERRRYVGGCRCAPCKEAERVYRAGVAERKAREQAAAEAAAAAAAQVPVEPTPSRVLAPCGTPSAWSRHLRNGEPIDDACQAAHTEAYRRYRATGTTKKVLV